MSKIVDDLMTKIISKKMIEQYEKIRQTGATDMYSYCGVIDIAKILKLKELAGISLEDYKVLLLNFQKLMKHYDIKQPELKKTNATNEQKNTKNTTDSTVKSNHKKS